MSQQYEYSSEDGTKIYPKCVVTIGGVPFVPKNYSLVTNKLFDNDSLTIHVPMHNLDITSIYLNSLEIDKFVLMEIWAGYVSYDKFSVVWTQSKEQTSDPSNDTIHTFLLQNYKTMLKSRWLGYVTGFELDYMDADNDDPDMINITGSDPSKLLKDTAFERDFPNEESRLTNVLAEINKHTPSFVIELDKRVSTEARNLLLGYEKSIPKDDGTETTKEIKYSTRGKSYFDVLQDLKQKARLKLVKDYSKLYDGKIKYTLAPIFSTDQLWKLYRNRDFKTCRLRLGDITTKTSKNVAIKVISAQTVIKDNKSQIEGTFPRDLSKVQNPEETFYKIVKAPVGMTLAWCENLAKHMAANYAKRDVTGELLLGNGIIEINVGDEIQIFDDDRLGNFTDKTNKLHTINFSGEKTPTFEISSISEDFEDGELTQKLEFHLSLNTDIFDETNVKLLGKEILPKLKKEENKNTVDMDELLRINYFKKQGLTE